jgi:hypothetical protein
MTKCQSLLPQKRVAPEATEDRGVFGAASRPGFRGFKRFRRFRGEGITCGDEYKVSAAYYPYRLPLVILSDSEGSRYLQHMRQKLLNTVLQKEPPDGPLPFDALRYHFTT